MEITDLGYTPAIESYREEHQLLDFDIGRVIAEHKERYIVQTAEGTIEAEITGKLRYTANSRADFPAVGDWVAISSFEETGIIHHILARKNYISRQAIGKSGEEQIIAANIDTAFIITAADRDFNLNRIERYLIICNKANIDAIVVITKTDLFEENQIQELIAQLKKRIKDIPTFTISNANQAGYPELVQRIEKGKTYCFLGSSGVGKSSLINNLSGNKIMQTGNISHSTGKGKHTTSHRQLFILEQGGLLIDNPGMREVGLTDNKTTAATTFEEITALAKMCKYKNCSHTHEKDCAIIKAVEEDNISPAAYENYIKTEKEKQHYQSSKIEKKRKDKAFGKMVKQVKKDKKQF